MGKFYVVWAGRAPGVYPTWDECRRQVDGFSGAVFRSFRTSEAAAAALAAGPDAKESVEPTPAKARTDARTKPRTKPRDDSTAVTGERPEVFAAGAIAVDAACSGNPGPMEYRGVALSSGEELFRLGPMHGTNNLGEFLAIVHGMAWLMKQGSAGPVFTDSRVAIGWVGRGRVGSTLKRDVQSNKVWTLVDRAHTWLAANVERPTILKWPTRRWGEIPADFGRK